MNVRGLAGAAVLLTLACGSTADQPGGGAAATEGPIDVAGSMGTLVTGFRLAVDGDVDDTVVQHLSLTDGSGTVRGELGDLGAVAYRRSHLSDYDVFSIIAPTVDRWHVLYAYCSDGQLLWLWHLDTSGLAARRLAASGSCISSNGPGTVSAKLMASTLSLPPLHHGVQLDARGYAVGPDGPRRTTATASPYCPITSARCR